MLRSVETNGAPAAIGPYSQAIIAGNLVFCSGQIALDPHSGQVVQGDCGVQTKQALANLEAVLRAAGSSLQRVVKCTVYLKSMEEFALMNTAYAAVFGSARPARATVEVARLPRDVRVEIDAIATV